MKLLLDENLSRRAIPFLLSDYPDSTQVAMLGMEQSSDREIWDYARLNGFVIVTRDSDYLDLSLILGSPPQVILLKTGNQTKAALISVLLKARQEIERALMIEGKSCVEIF